MQETMMAHVPEGAGDNSKGKKASRIIAPSMAAYMVFAMLIAFGLMYAYASNA
ncbi:MULTISPECIES: hypothetical protein [Sphingomonas]|nr:MULTISPECIES: hypothetical protein [Sphingomonas]